MIAVKDIAQLESDAQADALAAYREAIRGEDAQAAHEAGKRAGLTAKDITGDLAALQQAAQLERNIASVTRDPKKDAADITALIEKEKRLTAELRETTVQRENLWQAAQNRSRVQYESALRQLHGANPRLFG